MRLQIKWYPYEVNELGEVKSIERYIMRPNRWWSEPTPYKIIERILKRDIKYSRDVPLAKVQLYSEDWTHRICAYVARLVYCTFNWLNNRDVNNIHYRDGNPLNCALENLYETKTARKQSKRFKK